MKRFFISRMNQPNLTKCGYLTNLATEFQANRMIFMRDIARPTHRQTATKNFSGLYSGTSTDVWENTVSHVAIIPKYYLKNVCVRAIQKLNNLKVQY